MNHSIGIDWEFLAVGFSCKVRHRDNLLPQFVLKSPVRMTGLLVHDRVRPLPNQFGRLESGLSSSMIEVGVGKDELPSAG